MGLDSRAIGITLDDYVFYEVESGLAYAVIPYGFGEGLTEFRGGLIGVRRGLTANHYAR